MSTSIFPVDPNKAVPPERDEDERKDAIKRPIYDPNVPDSEPSPDVTCIIQEVNERVSPQWADNEIRCGRALAFGLRYSFTELKEAATILTDSKWRVTVTYDHKQGATMSIRPPQEQPKRQDTRGQRGYL